MLSHKGHTQHISYLYMIYACLDTFSQDRDIRNMTMHSKTDFCYTRHNSNCFNQCGKFVVPHPIITDVDQLTVWERFSSTSKELQNYQILVAVHIKRNTKLHQLSPSTTHNCGQTRIVYAFIPNLKYHRKRVVTHIRY